MAETVQADPLFMLGRPMTVAETTVIVRRATFDPGAFTPRRREHDDEFEALHVWQARAVVVALGEDGPSFESKWSNFEQAVENLRREHQQYVAALASREEAGA